MDVIVYKSIIEGMLKKMFSNIPHSARMIADPIRIIIRASLPFHVSFFILKLSNGMVETIKNVIARTRQMIMGSFASSTASH